MCDYIFYRMYILYKKRGDLPVTMSSLFMSMAEFFFIFPVACFLLGDFWGWNDKVVVFGPLGLSVLLNFLRYCSLKRLERIKTASRPHINTAVIIKYLHGLFSWCCY